MTPTDRSESIRREAKALGFDACGFLRAADFGADAAAGLAAYIKAGHHGSMQWLADRADVRGHPHAMWPDAKSVITVAMNYGPPDNPLPLLQQKSTGNISVYARGRDYHDVLKKRLKRLARWLASTHGGSLKLFVDTAPVMEKPLAAAAGLGWQGKHTNLVSREFGSWLFLGVIYTTLELAPDQPARDHCGRCTDCLDICPTDAFIGPRKIDARRCISYLTIEHKGPIPHEFRAAMGNRIYGCDDCLAICPWNKFASEARESAYHAREALEAPPLEHLLTLDDAGFRKFFSGSPIKRIGRDRFIRNCLIAAGNSGDAALLAPVKAHLDDADYGVSDAARWAHSKLCGQQPSPQ